MASKCGFPTSVVMLCSLEVHSQICFKEEGKLETYHHMLTRIIVALCPQDPTSYAYCRLHSEGIVDRDISAQEIFHMLQKFPLVTCGQSFIKLNVGFHIFRHISPDSIDCLFGSSFIDA